MIIYLFVFLVSFFTTILLTPVVRGFAVRIGAVDRPNVRKIHKKTTARLGGLSIFAGFLLSCLMFMFVSRFMRISVSHVQITGVILSSAFIMLVGLLDDIRGLTPATKFLCELAASFAVVLFGVQITFLSNPFDGLIVLGAASVPLTVLWVVGLTNAMNLIDGLDGLASGITAIASVTLFFVALRTHQIGSALLLLSLGGAAAGFLRYNFHPASIFLGDSGSLFLGFVLASASVIGVLKSTLVIAFVIPVLILGVPIFDTLFAILRRAWARVPLFEADNKHIHHRLLSAGFSHREAVMAIYFVCILLSLGALGVTFMKPLETAVVITIILSFSVFWALRIKENILTRLSVKKK